MNNFPKPNNIKYEKIEGKSTLEKLTSPWTSKIQENFLLELQKNLIIPEWKDDIIDLNFPGVVSINLIDQIEGIDFIYFSPEFYTKLEKLTVNEQTKILKKEIQKSEILEKKENILKINKLGKYQYYSCQKIEIYNKINLLNEESEFLRIEIKYLISMIRKLKKIEEYFIDTIHFHPNNFPSTQAKHLIEFIDNYEDENTYVKELVKILKDFLDNKTYLSISIGTKKIKNPKKIINESSYILYHRIIEKIEYLKIDLQNFYYTSLTLK